MKNQSKKIISFVFNDFKRDIRVYKENISLSQNGFKTEIVAISNTNLKKNEIKDSFKITRINCNVPIFPINLIIYWTKSIFRYRKENIFHCNDLYTLPIGVTIKIFFNKKAKIIYDCHELETDAGIYNNKPLLKLMAKFFEKKLIRNVDQVITVSESIAKIYQEKYNIVKPALILNCPNYKIYKKNNLFKKEFNIHKNKKILIYQGEFSKHKISGVNLLIEAFSNKKINKNVVLVLLGYGELFQKIKENTKLNNIYFKNAVSTDVYMDYISSADYGIHILDNSCLNHEYALPNKIFEYTMANLPIIVSNLAEMKDFVLNNKIGVVLEKDNVESLIRSIECILKLPKSNFQKINQIYCWEKQEEVLINIYKQL